MVAQLSPPRQTRRWRWRVAMLVSLLGLFALVVLLVGWGAAVLFHRMTTEAFLTPRLRLIMAEGGTLVIVDEHRATSMQLGPGDRGIRTLGRAHGHLFGTVEGANFSPDRAWFMIGEDSGTLRTDLTEASVRRYLPGASQTEPLTTFDAFKVWCEPRLTGGVRK